MQSMTKYGNTKIPTTEGTFDSKRELTRWRELQMLEKAGEIHNLRRQVKFELIPKVGKNRATHYIADFVYKRDGETVIEDAKGYRTEVYKLKRKLMAWVHGIEIKEV